MDALTTLILSLMLIAGDLLLAFVFLVYLYPWACVYWAKKHKVSAQIIYIYTQERATSLFSIDEKELRAATFKPLSYGAIRFYGITATYLLLLVILYFSYFVEAFADDAMTAIVVGILGVIHAAAFFWVIGQSRQLLDIERKKNASS